MATKVTEDMILQMNKLYLQLKTYAAVAREVGVSPTTVKRYINPNFEEVKEIKREVKLQEINIEIFRRENWDLLISLMPREEKSTEEVKKEIYL